MGRSSQGASRVGAALPAEVDALVIGAGFGGLYMLHKLRGLGFDAHVVEAGGGVGGTWYWNRYPGARCDVESVQYSYAFDEELQQEWVWTERYATQPEILRYAEHVADRFGLWEDITFDTRVVAATYDEERNLWRIATDGAAEVTARYLIAAVGCLSAAQIPQWPGQECFAGETYHTGAWPQGGVDLAGKRVAVIGTGSSGIQLIPSIAGEVEHLTVFQRSANWTMPARNRPLPPEELEAIKARYGDIRHQARLASNGRAAAGENRPLLGDSPEERDAVLRRYWERGGLDFTRVYADIQIDVEANGIVADFIRARIAETVADPVKRKILTPPRDHLFCSKRPCVDTDYFATFNRPNTELVDVSAEPIVELTPTGLRTTAASYDADVIIFATGYDAMTGSILRLNITGRDGVALATAWEAGPSTYLGLQVHGFPNLFVIAGPGSPSVLSNVILAIEQHVEWLGDLLVHVRASGADVVEAEAGAQKAWTRHVAEAGERTFLARANSWYRGTNIPGKPAVMMPYAGGTNVYRQTCDEIAAQGYPGLQIRSSSRWSLIT